MKKEKQRLEEVKEEEEQDVEMKENDK